MSLITVTGIIAVIALIIFVGIYSGKKVNDAKDFMTGGGAAGTGLVMGSVMSTMIGGQSTMGTSQLAFTYGLSACWFTVGTLLGCIFLALCYTRPLRNSGCVAETQIISREYGSLNGNLASVLCSMGMFISLLSQVISCSSLIGTFTADFSYLAAVVISVIIIGIYVIFGGAWTQGMGGVVKVVLLCVASLTGLVFCFIATGGLSAISETLCGMFVGTDLGSVQKAAGSPEVNEAADIAARYFTFTARGKAKDIGSGLSLLLGILSTQTYAQIVLSASSEKASRRGILLGAVFMPVIGFAHIMIGMFMREHYITQAEVNALIAAGKAVPDMPVIADTLQTYSVFLTDHMPPLVSGVFLGTLFISMVSTGAGVCLGMVTTIIKAFRAPGGDSVRELRMSRILILVILALNIAAAMMIPNTTLNDMGFLSFGLRCSVVFLPLVTAMGFRGHIDSRFITASIVLSPLSIIAGKLTGCPVDTLYLGMGVSILCCLMGAAFKKLRG